MSPKKCHTKPDQRPLTSGSVVADMREARRWLDRAALLLEGDATDRAYVKAAAEIGAGYAQLAAVARPVEIVTIGQAQVGAEVLASLKARQAELDGRAAVAGPVITETPETGAPVAPGATNAPPPVSGDDQDCGGELRAALAGALNGVGVARFRNIVEVGAPWTLDAVADDLAEALLAEGWRMPIECDGSRGCAAVVHGEGCFVLAMSAGGAQ